VPTSELSGRIDQISISSGGVPKLPIPEGKVTELGIVGDRQTSSRVHGGPHKALCLFSLEQLEVLRSEGHPIGPGSTGENVTIAGVDWRLVLPGSRLRLGREVLIEVTGYADACWKNAGWFTDGDFTHIDHAARPGFGRVYARVLETGVIRPGDSVELLVASAAERLSRQRIPSIRWPEDFR